MGDSFSDYSFSFPDSLGLVDRGSSSGPECLKVTAVKWHEGIGLGFQSVPGMDALSPSLVQ